MSTAADIPQPPAPRHVEHHRVHHGHDVVDPFDWMRDKESPELLAHLEAENAYADARTGHLADLEARIVSEIKDRTQETDTDVPVLERGWWYYTRTHAGRQYPTWHRVADTRSGRPDPSGTMAGEQLVLDGNAEAEGQAFFKVSEIVVAPDARHAAIGIDLDGGELFDVRVVDLTTGETVDDSVRGVGYGLAWTTDSTRLIYVRTDDAWRPHEVWSHAVGSDPTTDERLVREDDETYWTWIETSRDGRWLVVHHAATTSGEALLVPLDADALVPQVVSPRRPGLEYTVEVAGDHLLVVHNLTQKDFTLSAAPLGPSAPEDWSDLLRSADGERILAAHAFAGHAVVELRAGGLPALRVLPRTGSAGNDTPPDDDAAPTGGGPAGGAGPAYGPARDVVVDGELTAVALGEVREWESDEILVETQSFLTPPTVSAHSLADGSAVVVKQKVVPGYEPERYVERREWATAGDGTRIPLSIVHRADVTADGTAPGLLYGYGSYEVSVDPAFSAERLPLLDRGVVFAVAHVRGGGELGRSWYEDGKLDRKRNTFTDFVDAAHHVLDTGLVARGRLAAQGRSAGGLLMGAVANLAPETFRVIHAGVPFVDALTTILDPSLPLTTGEWEEWGDPLHDPAFYDYMATYAPYDNLREAPYPAILATTSLNDIRVMYVEPAKWVARLREVTTSDPADRPVLLRCEMVAGHGGRSGRYDRWSERAAEWAFVLDQLGVADRP
ncbi:S9 family peptidase [Georgenia sp. Z1344]|uniref:S9 family peptidase n=1 Tax=Georgenia sp. Z1344 TaxID=3416706 RepID=UPI003CF3B1DE